MTTITTEKTDAMKLKRIFGIKSYDEVLEDLAISRKQAKSGKLIPADKVIAQLSS